MASTTEFYMVTVVDETGREFDIQFVHKSDRSAFLKSITSSNTKCKFGVWEMLWEV